jgi:hypothetical protein
MPLQKLQFKPGINKEITNYSNEQGWSASDKIRFKKGFPEQIGGWTRVADTQVIGTPRTLINWIALDGDNLVGVGTNIKYYVLEGQTYTDKTPVRELQSLGADPFTSVSSSTTVTVTDTGHGADDGSYVTFTGATTFNGIPAAEINKEHRLTYVNANSYTITVDSAASGAGAGGGSSAKAEYQINPGQEVFSFTSGWSSSTWSTGSWGQTGFSDLAEQLRLWIHDNYGEDIIANVYQGDIFYLDKDGTNSMKTGAPYTSSSDITYRMRSIKDIATAASASNLTYIPTQVTYSMVSQQARHVICFGADKQNGSGAFDPLLVRWASSEDYQDWRPLSTNSAGDFRLEQGSQIVGAVKTRQEILIFTDTAVYAMQYVGFPYVFSFNLLASNISLMSPNAVSVANNIVFWMGRDKFYVFDGQVRALPSTLRTFVYDNINTEQEFQVISGTNEEYNEVWWFYPTGTETQINNYVVFNYLENIWYYGTLSRSAWLDSGLRQSPIAFDYNRRALNHEVGVDDASGTGSVAINSFIESADFDIGDGDQFSFVWRMIPDLTFTGSESVNPDVTLTLTPRDYTGGSYTSETGKSVQASALSPQELYTNQIDIRVRGRQLKLRPVLPIPPDSYERRYFDELNRVLRLFFSQNEIPLVFQTARLQVLDQNQNVIIDQAFNETSGELNIVLTNLPTSASGLATGTVYNDSGTLKVA